MSVQVKPIPLKETFVNISESNPNEDEWYPLLPQTDLGEIMSVKIEQQNDETDAKNIEVRLTADDTEYVGTVSAPHSLNEFAVRSPIQDALILLASQYNMNWYTTLKGHSLQLDVRITSTPGTNQVLLANAHFFTAPAGTNWWWKHYPTAVVNQDPPVNDLSYYEILGEVEDVRFIYFGGRQINDEAALKNVELTATIDSIAYTRNHGNLGSGAWNYWHIRPEIAAALLASTTTYNTARYETLDGQLGKVEIRIRSAPGTNQELDGRVVYELYEEVA